MTRAPAFLAVFNPARSAAFARWKSVVESSPDLAPLFQSPSLAVFASPGTQWLPIARHGCVIGSLHTAGSAALVDRIGPISPDALGAWLIEKHWGDYVAIMARDAPGSGKRLHAVRAPSGGLHAFRTQRDGLLFIASHVELLHGLGITRTTIDWHFVAEHLAFSHLHARRTGIAGIEEILPGEEAIDTATGSMSRPLWSPWNFTAAARRIDDFGLAAARVHGAILLSVAAHVAPEAHVALELSGGLDSSVVAAALSAAGRTAVAVNLATPGSEGDERLYARAVSASTGIPLIEIVTEGEIDLTHVVPRIEARTGMLAMLRLADRAFADVGREQGVTAFVNGTGGDCVFCSLGTSAPAADRLRTYGPGLGFIRTIADIARVHDSNIWTVARLSFRAARRSRPSPVWPRNRQFLADEGLPDQPPPHHWLDEPPHTPGGARAHVHAILASYAHLDGYGRHAVAPSLFPLLAQPVVEACLTVPSWLWVAGGRDRAVARAAFSPALPAMVAERRTKGAMDAFCARIFEVNRARLKPFLLDGLIADRGLLDRDAIEAYLARPFAKRDQTFYHLLPVIDAELWARALIAASP